MNSVASAFNKISSIGITDELSNLEKIRTRIYNQSALFISIALIVTCAESIIMNERGVVFSFWVWSIPLITIYLNHRKKYVFAKLTMTGLLPSMGFFFWLLLGHNSGLGYTFFAFFLAVLISYDRINLIILNMILINILFFIGLYYVNNYEGLLAQEVGALDIVINYGMANWVIAWAMFQFIMGIRDQEQKLFDQTLKLKENNTKLEDLNEQNEVKTNLLSMIAHDLRGPVTSFKNVNKNLNYLIQQNDIKRIQKLGNHLEHSGNKLFDSLDQLLNWAVIQKDHIRVSHRQIKLCETLQEVLDDLNEAVRVKNIQLNILLHHDTELNTDRNILQIILKNIIQNAIKFSPKDADIDIRFKRSEKALLIEVEDYGKGMSPEFMHGLQNKELQPQPIKGNSYGLGLPICYYFIDLLKGNLSFKSVIGQGTTARIELPIEKSNIEPEFIETRHLN